ncbi:MAG: hypothetical protein H8E28_12385 [Anaerolineae bacterium]|nr:hypothetical protein [Anaerolineae bacterium]
MKYHQISKDKFFANLHPEWPNDMLPEIRVQITRNPRKVVVLDDDPTGTQTVYGVPVLTEWSIEALCAEFTNDLPAFYLLTNSRALPLEQAKTLNTEIGENLKLAAQQTGRDFVAISRSDSTLRGHFPGEVMALAKSLGEDFKNWITLVIPYFLEGGRYTVNDVHYVDEGEWFTPAGQTEFASDKAFGYKASNLCDWVAEKMDGRIASQDVAAITLDDIRRGGPERVTQKLNQLAAGDICIVNAISYRDIEVFVSGLLKAEAQGQQFLYRTAASFVRARIGLGSRPILTRANLNLKETGGGLVIVGSYVPKSTTQVQKLLKIPDLTAIELDVTALLEADQRQIEINRAISLAEQALQSNQDVVIYTGRKLISGTSAEASLAIGQQVSDGLVEIVQSIAVRPRYLLAKGGITSSDIATKGLQIKRALVSGQILPGVPVWQAGSESHWPGLTYIVFPGNVGSPEALANIVSTLR